MASYAYIICVMLGGTAGISDVYMLRSFWDRIPPYGMPDLVRLELGVVLLYFVYCFRPLMQLAMNLMIVGRKEVRVLWSV